MWLYGSGFPKSMNLSKGLEAKEKLGNACTRNKRKIEQACNTEEYTLKQTNNGAMGEIIETTRKQYIPDTDLSKQWQGWGTCLKPSYESIIVAQKPYNIELYLLIEILDILNEVVEKCQLKLDVKIVEKFLKLNQAKQGVEENIVLKNVENKMFTKEDLLEVMGMLQSILMGNTNLNTESLCLNFLVEICNQMNKYTIETKINLITELKILKLLVVENISKNTIKEKKTKQLGMMQNVLTVEGFLKEEKLKLNYINTLSVQENAILKEEKGDLHPNINQIIVARKPFKGSLVDNVIQNGVGGINIDECRVSTVGELIDNHKTAGTPFMRKAEDYKQLDRTKSTDGRFPANTILTYDETDFDEVCGGFPQSKGASSQNNYSNGHIYRGQSLQESNTSLSGYREWYNDNGSASRYFYNAKASKKDRDEGLEDFEEKKVGSLSGGDNQKEILDDVSSRFRTKKKNIHPTVKPTELMQYLVRLVSPKGSTILDPFMGSGSTGKAVMFENKERQANYKFIGIEREKEYCDIAEARIKWACGEEEKQETDENEEEQITFDDLL